MIYSGSGVHLKATVAVARGIFHQVACKKLPDVKSREASVTVFSLKRKYWVSHFHIYNNCQKCTEM